MIVGLLIFISLMLVLLILQGIVMLEKPPNSIEDFLAFAVVLLVASVVFGGGWVGLQCFDIAPSLDTSDETTIYYRHLNEESHRWEYAKPVTYVVDKTAQIVIRKVKGSIDLEKYSDCVVIDRENWSCGLGSVRAIIDGDYYILGRKISEIENLDQVSWLRWFVN